MKIKVNGNVITVIYELPFDILETVGKTTVKDGPSVAIFLCVLLLSVFDKQLEAAFPAVNLLFSPVVYVLLAGCAGLVLRLVKGGEKA